LLSRRISPDRAWRIQYVFSYSLRVSILVEIAEKADVPVEGVIRVLTREPVSDAVMERVLGVLDDLNPEQTRAVQRFALAALHDVLPRGEPEVPRYPEAEAAEEAALSAAPDDQGEQLPAAPSPSDGALVELSSVLSELAEAVRDLRRETDEERRERVDDLAVLIELITTGWQGLDARLGRIEKQIGRMDAARRPDSAALPVSAPSPPPPPSAAETPPPVDAAEPNGRRSRVPLAAVLTLAGAVIGTFAVLQFGSAGPDVADLVSARDEPAQTSQGSSSTTGSAPTTTTVRTSAPATPAPAPTTPSVLGTAVRETQPSPKPKPPSAKTTTSAAPANSAFKPTRNWAWAPVPKADYYSVEFTKGGTRFYRATPTEPRLSLPASVVFTPGAYRWIVRAGFGPRTAKQLGAPVVNSGFTVS
jgi:hypothetical protein